jgi:hypothetical protein
MAGENGNAGFSNVRFLRLSNGRAIVHLGVNRDLRRINTNIRRESHD